MKKQLCYHHKSSFMVTLIFDVCALPNSIPFKNIIKIFKPMEEVKNYVFSLKKFYVMPRWTLNGSQKSLLATDF